jgi:hypothetical protein
MNTEVNVINLSYLAAFLEASGHIGIYRYTNKKNGDVYYTTSVRIHNQDERLMRWLQETFGGYVHKVKENPNYPMYRPELIWCPKAQDIVELGSILSPYMFIKKRDLELMVKIRLTYVNNNKKWMKSGISTNDYEVIEQREIAYKEFKEIFEQRLNHKRKHNRDKT